MMRKFFLSQKTWVITLVIVISGGLSAYKLDYFEINKQLDIFANLFREVNTYYVDETEPDEMMETAVKRMLKGLDPYTTYIPENRVEDYRIQTTGKYGGIGSTIRKKGDYVMIYEPYQDFPAAKAGLKPGDYLIEADGKSLKGKNTEQVSDILKGSPGSALELKIKRGGEEQLITIEREEIHIKSVPYYGWLEPGIGYITLTGFTEGASEEIRDAYKALEDEQELNGLVLDLRNNPGGLLSEAVNVSNLFIDKGKEVVSTRGKVKSRDRTYKTPNRPLDTEIPLVVLINGGSASASEIVSGVIQDYDRGVVLGRTSYGKGLVQETRQLSYGAQVKITVSKYYTPSGRCIQAINYAERDKDGSVTRVPDSLRNSFTTANGRLVKDGGGIDPDVEVKAPQAAQVLYSLVGNDLIFEFVSEQLRGDQMPVQPGQFQLSDDLYKQFLAFLEDKDYHYETDTEKAIELLKEVSEEEKYAALDAEIEKLKAEFAKIKGDDLSRHEAEIRQQIEEEFMGQAYYRSGRLKQIISEDEMVAEAVNHLKDTEKYNGILTAVK
jgi:carboxyl-terminal processing protease